MVLIAFVSGSCSKSAHIVYSSPAVNAARAPLLPTDVAALPTMDVATFHQLLYQLHGTPVVVNVWGSWCAPCKTEIPLLIEAARSHPDVQFVGVDIQDSRDGATAFIASFRIPYPSVFDPPAAIRTDFAATGQPDTYFFDSTGEQVAFYRGPIPAETLAADIAEISS
jgi:cytochrome c biogenesis protein CcmG/thiol:disulfide interchange protein DsbE